LVSIIISIPISYYVLSNYNSFIACPPASANLPCTSPIPLIVTPNGIVVIFAVLSLLERQRVEFYGDYVRIIRRGITGSHQTDIPYSNLSISNVVQWKPYVLNFRISAQGEEKTKWYSLGNSYVPKLRTELYHFLMAKKNGNEQFVVLDNLPKLKKMQIFYILSGLIPALGLPAYFWNLGPPFTPEEFLAGLLGIILGLIVFAIVVYRIGSARRRAYRKAIGDMS